MSHRRRDGGLWYADDFLLPADGSRDVSLDLIHVATNLMEPGDKFVFRPDGQYLCNNEITLRELTGLTFLGNNATLFGTVERNSKYFYVLLCQDIEMRDIHIRGYDDFDSNGSQMVAGTGTPTVSGLTMQLNAQNESVFIPRGPTGPYALGRDKDGYCRIRLTLSDSAQVANDCVIVITDGYGTTLETVTIPLLTSTPTIYEIRHRLLDPRDRLDWEIKKSTATANTITITFAKTICPGAYNTNVENSAGWDFTGTKGFRLFNCSAEGIGGDALQASDPGDDTEYARDALIRGFMSRCCGRQGMSFNANKTVRVEDFEIYFPGRSGIDIEPEVQGMRADDIGISRGRIWTPVNAGVACTGWAWIERLKISGVDFFDCGRAAVEGGSIGGTIENCTSSNVHRTDGTGGDGTLWPDFMITGQDMKLKNIDADRGFFFHSDTRLDFNGVTQNTGGHSLDGFSVQRPGLYGAVHVQAGVVVAVSNGPKGQINPVPVYGRNDTHRAVGPAGGIRRGSALDLETHQNRLPASYAGGIAYTHLWMPGGHDFVNEPLSRVAALSGGPGAVVTLQASTARTTTGTTTAVDVGEASTVWLRLYITAISGTLPTLDVAVQQSHDNVTFTTIDSFPQVLNTTSTEYSRMIEFQNSARYLRLSYTIAGTSPSFTFSVIGGATVVGNNLRGLAVAVTAAATTHAVTFTPPGYSNPTSVALAGTTGGTLTPSATYYYRVAGRRRRGGPVVPLAESSVALTGAQNAVSMSVVGMENILAGRQLAGLTIYRGTTTGVYTARYDMLPNTRLYSVNLTQTLTDLGPTMTIVVPYPVSQTTLGYPATIPARTGSFVPVDETGYELDAAYDVWPTTNWNSGQPWITNKARTGFTINFDPAKAAPGDGSGRVSWALIR